MPDRRATLAPRLEARGLPPPAPYVLDALEDIVDERTLGATNHVALALPLIARIAGDGATAAEGGAVADETTRLIAETRGSAAPIVANALAWLWRGLDRDDPDLAAALSERAAAWARRALARRRTLVDIAAERLAQVRAPLLFDFSSTVADIALALAARGGISAFVVPESRAIAGGRRYVEALAQAGAPIHFMPDAAIEHAAARADVLLLGAERVTRDGAIVNTIGSIPAARAAIAHGMPIYGAADLFKVGSENAADLAAPPFRTYPELAEDLPGRVSTEAPELELVPAAMITAVLTERGPIEPGAIAAAVETSE